MTREEKKKYLKISYLAHIIFFVMFGLTMLYSKEWTIFWIIFIGAAINAAISGYLFMDLVTDK